MIEIDMPEWLQWQTGTEYGVLGIADVVAAGHPVRCRIQRDGPLLEAVAFAVHQLDLADSVSFEERALAPDRSRICLMPRVYPLGEDEIVERLSAGQLVVTSDPEVTIEHERLHVFYRRDWSELADKLIALEGRSDKEEPPGE